MLFGRKKSPQPSNAQAQAASMLVTQGALFELTTEEAEQVVAYMHPRRFKAGTVLIREGEAGEDHSMALILNGEVAVENQTPNDSIVVTVLGPGGLLGELALIDEGPRSATCIAVTDLGAAVLTREALAALLEEKPGVAARLLMAIGKRVGDRLRDTNRRLMALTRVSKAMEEELDATHAVNKRLMQQLEQLQKQTGAAALPVLAKAADNGPAVPLPHLNKDLGDASVDHDATTIAPNLNTGFFGATTLPPPLSDAD